MLRTDNIYPGMATGYIKAQSKNDNYQGNDINSPFWGHLHPSPSISTLFFILVYTGPTCTAVKVKIVVNSGWYYNKYTGIGAFTWRRIAAIKTEA
jgi:hypothetical protein